MKKIAIIGASYLQNPLIERAKDKGYETHVFAWRCGDIGETSADYFYPISIVEKDQILAKCRDIKVDGVCTIASDLASITANYVANAMGLIGNPMECVEVSTNKHKMRERFEKNGDPSPKSILIESISDLENVELNYPIIVKPIDRSGSRGITMLADKAGLEEAIEHAKEQGIEKCALVEEYVNGQEYSVEYISWKGHHSFLTVTKKYTTGAPNFIETGHLEPAPLDPIMLDNIQTVVSHALNSLGVEYGASHSELKIGEDGTIKLIEIGARMGGDLIGSSLVKLSTGCDYVGAVIDVAMGIRPSINPVYRTNVAVRFVINEKDIDTLNEIKKTHPEVLIEEDVHTLTDDKVTDSHSRFGYYLFSSNNLSILERYLP